MYKYNPHQQSRKQLRLKDYDYSKQGLYFITISVKDKLCLFGEIKNDNLELFEGGKIIEKYWLELENKFENIKLHNYVVMPNHFHGIIEIVENKKDVGADLCVCPDDECICPDDEYACPVGENINNSEFLKSGGTHRFTPTGGKFIHNAESISTMVQWFKTMTTNAYIKLVHEGKANPFNKQLWQRNFYEHIIRDEKGYIQIIEYIEQNILKWEEDTFYYTEI